MASELDHIFICVSPGAPEADRLAALGLAEGTPNEHPGQGTACRRFFFTNVYLELLWVHDMLEARSEASQRTHLWPRWSKRVDGACPFGFSFRPAECGQDQPLFASWPYRPSYLPEPLHIDIAANVGLLSEPMLCYLAFARRSDSYPPARRQPLNHPIGVRELTRVKLFGPHAVKVSPELQAVLNAKLIQLEAGAEYFVELGFDGESRDEKRDLRPALPFILCW